MATFKCAGCDQEIEESKIVTFIRKNTNEESKMHWLQSSISGGGTRLCGQVKKQDSENER